MSYKLAVCDDSQTDSSYISTLVTDWALLNGHLIKINTFPSAEAFLFHYADEKDYDILMLDIKMDRMDGMELAKRFVNLIPQYRSYSSRDFLILWRKDMKFAHSTI